MTTGAFDCRSYDVQSYAQEIARKRRERFSTIYACCFITASEAASTGAGPQSDGRPPADLLLSASSTGELRLYRVPDMVQRWTAGQQSAEPACSWGAHQGPLQCLAKATTASGEVVVFSGGEDGHVRGWRLADILALASQQQQQQQRCQQQQQHQPPGAAPSPGLQPCLSVRLPRAESALAAISLPPAVQALALAGQGVGAGQEGTGTSVLFIGCSDGGVHSLDLASGAVSQPRAQGGGHAAAVLAADYHGPSSSLATGSEDGTIRLWDARSSGGAASCVRILDATAGREVAPGSEALRCLRNTHVACLRLEPSGSWLVCGQGGTAGGGSGSLALWNLGMAQRARQVATGFAPQALSVQPAEVLVAGSEPALSRFSASLEGPTRLPLATRSALALAVHPESGAVAVGGCNASLELLSKYGKKTGGVYFVSDED